MSNCWRGRRLRLLWIWYMSTINKLLPLHQRLHVMDDKRLEERKEKKQGMKEIIEGKRKQERERERMSAAPYGSSEDM